MKAISILQPSYLPYLGHFEQMAVTDLYVHMDDVQYTRKDWRNRNRVRTADGWTWLTVPVKKCPRPSPLNEVAVSYRQPWLDKHLKTLRLSYGKAPFFQPLFSEIEEILEQRLESLVELDVALLGCLRRHLGITGPEARSSSVPRRSSGKVERILEICRHFGADLLYDGKSAASFIDPAVFAAHGVEVVFQDYRHPDYRQQYPGFVPNLSAIDVIMNTGPRARDLLLAYGDPLGHRKREGTLRQ